MEKKKTMKIELSMSPNSIRPNMSGYLEKSLNLKKQHVEKCSRANLRVGFQMRF